MPEAPAVRAWVALGANLGNARETLLAACEALDRLHKTRLLRRSSLYRTAPIDSSGPDYLNAVAELETSLVAQELLAGLQAIESAHGRERPYHNAPRTLDLDLLLFGHQQIDTPALTVPHPRLHQRAFVLHPLAELAPELSVPGRGTIAELLPGVADQRVERLSAGS